MIPEFDMSDEKIRDSEKIIAEIKRYNLPVFIWGYKLTAQVLTKLLGNYDVKVASWVTERTDINQEGVISKDELTKNYPSYILLGGYIDAFRYSEPEIKSTWKGCQKFYVLSDCYDRSYIESIEDLSREFYLKNKKNFDEVYDNLADDFSKKSFYAYVQAKVLKNNRSLIPYVISPQYFFTPSLWKKDDSDVMLDCGAFDGDSILDFVAFSGGKYKRIIACEPDIVNLEKLRENMRVRDIKNVVALNVGLSDKKGSLYLTSRENAFSQFTSAGDIEVPIDTIDHIENDTGGV